MSTASLALATACAMGLAAAPVPADNVLLTKNGRTFVGQRMERGEGHVLVHFEHGDVRVPDGLVLEVHLDSEFRGSPKEAKAQSDRLAEGLEHSYWGKRQEGETPHFKWAFTIPRPVLAPIQLRAEQFYGHFQERWGLESDPRRPRLYINLYRNHQEFRTVGGAGDGSLGYFMFLGNYDLNLFFDRIDPASTDGVLCFLLSHYAQKCLNHNFRMPKWPGQGLARYYRGMRWNERTGDFEWSLIEEELLETIQRDLTAGEPQTIPEIVDGDGGKLAWDWALAYFLITHDEHAPGFDRYIAGLARDASVERIASDFGLTTVEGAESLRYLRHCLGLETQGELDRLQAEFWAFAGKQESETAKDKERAAIRAWRRGQDSLAQDLLGEADSEGHLSAYGCYLYAELLGSKDPILARALYERAVEMDPLEGQFWSQLGEMTEDPSESFRLRSLAEEIGLEPIFERGR